MLHNLYWGWSTKETHGFQVRSAKTNLAIYLSWRDVLGAEIVEHDLYLDGVAVEALVHLCGLDEVPDV